MDTPAVSHLPPFASLLAGAAVFCLLLEFVRIRVKSLPRFFPRGEATFERENRIKLYHDHWVFRYFGYIIDQIAVQLPLLGFDYRIHVTEHYLTVLGEIPPWSAPRFLAAKMIEAMILATIFALVFFVALGPVGSMIVWFVVFAVLFFLFMNRLQEQATERKKAVVARLPYAIDLLALLLHANSTLEESLDVAAGENTGHPISEELKMLLHQLNKGISYEVAFDSFKDRIRDPGLDEVVNAITIGKVKGTPLSQTLSEQADQMRIKRQQQGEKISAEIGVKMLFPGLIIMIACLILILAPFILMALDKNSGVF